MLQNLHIRNMALIEEADVDLSGGLNILTGETGAGKSILVDSIGLALGGKIQRDPAGKKGTALLELTFSVQDPGTVTQLKEMGIEPEEDQVLISRRITDGRSVIRVNGETKTLAEVRDAAALLIDIHGQSEHQKLLKSEHQLELLDAFGHEETAEKKRITAEAYRTWNQLRTELAREDMPEAEREKTRAFLEYEVSEIREAALKEGEDEELEKRYRRLTHAKRIAETVGEIHRLTGYDEDDSAGEQIGHAFRRLESLVSLDEELGGLSEQLGSIDSLLSDFNRDLTDYADSLSFEEGSFEEVEERLNLVNRMKARYGRTISDVLASLEDKEAELDRLEHYEENLAKLKKAFAEAENCLKDASGALTEVRKKYAAAFSKEAEKEFRDLNFARAEFSIEFSETDSWSANGRDHVEFVISTNPGMPRKPLRTVVSGGELSRLMLGIRAMFADTDGTETIIFDEVDAGISGRTAQKAAEKMADLARTHQVICITHLPQIAAMADAHYGISKSLTDEAAITAVNELSGEEAVEELARLIGGARITENTLNSAREMKEMCRQYKENAL